jgi:uncharacterized protein YcbX
MTEGATKVGTVKEVRRYPIKSMAGEMLDRVELGSRGLPGDRVWAVRDEVRGGIRGAKKIPKLMTLSARFTTPVGVGVNPAEILFPDGSRASTEDADINERLSSALDHRVSLWPLLPADALDHYRRGAPTHEDLEVELRAIFGRATDEPLPDLSVFPPEIFEYESPPGTYFDAFPLLLLTSASLDSMQQRVPASVFDVRRFRPNFVVADTTSANPFPELEWCGKRLRVGEATVQVTIECPRCVMVTHGQDDLPKDPGVMRALVKEAGGNLGVYATVEQPGRVSVGDSVELLD